MSGSIALLMTVTHAAAVVIAFGVGHKAQFLSLIKAAQELGPDVVALVHQLATTKSK